MQNATNEVALHVADAVTTSRCDILMRTIFETHKQVSSNAIWQEQLRADVSSVLNRVQVLESENLRLREDLQKLNTMVGRLYGVIDQYDPATANELLNLEDTNDDTDGMHFMSENDFPKDKSSEL